MKNLPKNLPNLPNNHTLTPGINKVSNEHKILTRKPTDLTTLATTKNLPRISQQPPKEIYENASTTSQVRKNLKKIYKSEFKFPSVRNPPQEKLAMGKIGNQPVLSRLQARPAPVNLDPEATNSSAEHQNFPNSNFGGKSPPLPSSQWETTSEFGMASKNSHWIAP